MLDAFHSILDEGFVIFNAITLSLKLLALEFWMVVVGALVSTIDERVFVEPRRHVQYTFIRSRGVPAYEVTRQ
jgi:hypothetical protein